MDKLSEVLNLKDICGYITFLKTGVPDLGCEDFQLDVCIQRPKSKKPGRVVMIDNSARPNTLHPITKDISFQDLQSPLDSTDIITQFDKNKATIIDGSLSTLKSPDENHFASSPVRSPSNDFRSADCNEILRQELDESASSRNSKKRLDDDEKLISKSLVSQSSIEIELDNDASGCGSMENIREEEYVGEVNKYIKLIL